MIMNKMETIKELKLIQEMIRESGMNLSLLAELVQIRINFYENIQGIDDQLKSSFKNLELERKYKIKQLENQYKKDEKKEIFPST